VFTRKDLFAKLGGRHRFYRLRTEYKKAKPQRSRTGPGILTADEVFLQRARAEGFSDREIYLFIDHVDF